MPSGSGTGSTRTGTRCWWCEGQARVDPRIRHVGVALVVAVAVLATVRSDLRREPRFDPARDSITVRAYFKGWGSSGPTNLDMLDMEWKVDSTTVRFQSTGRVIVRSRQRRTALSAAEFEILRVESPDSVWVRANSLVPMVPRWNWGNGHERDSVLITRDVRWWSTNSIDGGTWIGLRTVGWPEARRAVPRVPTYSLDGRAVDAASGLPCRLPSWQVRRGAPTATVREAWGTAYAKADSLGYFHLKGLHEGWVKLNVSSLDYSFASRLIHVPADSVTVRLIAGWPDLLDFAPMPPTSAIPSRPPSIAGLWRGGSSWVGGSPDPEGDEKQGLFRFAMLMDSSRCRVEWRHEGGGPEHAPLEPQFGLGRFWSSTRPTERGNLGWEFVVIGDTLVGQLLDPYTRVVAREFWARRVGD